MLVPQWSDRIGTYRRRSRGVRTAPTRARRSRRFVPWPGPESLETRLTLTGNITVTGASRLDTQDQPLTDVSAGQVVEIQVDFTTKDLPADASYSIDFTLDGLTLSVNGITAGAGISRTEYWSEESADFYASPGLNQATASVDADQSVPDLDAADNTTNFSFTAALPQVSYPSYSVSQLREAYGISSLPAFGSSAADGTGQTIAVIDPYNDPTILSDLDDFDQAMHMTTNASPTLYQAYGAASSVLTVFNQSGTDITSRIGTSGQDGVPDEDPSDSTWQLEVSIDVEWAHAIAPGARIDLIECDGSDDSVSFANLVAGAKEGASLPGVSVVSMSWVWLEEYLSGPEELADDEALVTPSGHRGVTFLACAGDAGVPGGYPAFSPNVVAVGATQITINGDASGYSDGGEVAWSYPTPRTLDDGSSSYSQAGAWTRLSGGFSGTVSTAPAGSASTASWTTSISKSDEGWSDDTQVSATWVADPSNASNASYEIYDGTPATGTRLATVPVNQQVAPVGVARVDGGPQFQSLGYYYSETGTLTVVLNANSANGNVVADAVGIAPAWATSGGQSQYEPEPSYQDGVQSTGYRTTPDVAFNGSSNSGVTCFQDGVAGPDYFGTSLATPCWAGLIALVNQGRVAAGGTPLDGAPNPTQTLQALYSLPAGDFNDITSGYNGKSAQAGYDELTGLGSPVVASLIPDLVSYDMPTRLVITTQPPASATAGASFGLTVAVEDPFGDVITGDNGYVTLALAGGDGSVGGAVTVPVIDGIAIFSGVTLDSAGTDTLQASSGSLPATTTDAIDVVPAGAAQVRITIQPPASVTAGDAFGLGVTVVDAFGNVVPSFTGDLVLGLASGPGGGNLAGTVVEPAVSGVASFAGLTLDTAGGGYTIQAMGGGLVAADSDLITVSPGAATRLVVMTQPPAQIAPAAGFWMRVAAEDALGNVTTSPAGDVTVALAGGAGGDPSVRATAPFVGGIAAVTGFAPNRAGVYSLQIGAGGLAAAVSDSFAVTAPPTIIGERVLKAGGRPHGKVVGFELLFSDPLDPSRAGDAANYAVTRTVGHGRKERARPVRVRAVYLPSASRVSLMLGGGARFPRGGRIVVSAAPPSGIMNTAGIALGGNGQGVPGVDAVLSVRRKGRELWVQSMLGIGS
jgi:hypothetical protein